MKTYMRRIFALLVLGSLPLAANAVTVTGVFLVDNAWSLIHDSALPGGLGGPAAGDFLRWDPDQTITMDLTAGLLTATGPQSFTLTSNNGDTATLTLNAMSFDLSGPNGFAGGTLEYNLNVNSGPYPSVAGGTFVFVEQLFAGFPFNSSTFIGSQLEIFGWGGDVPNDLGIDFGIKAVIPVPGALVLFGSAVLGLGWMRRRR